MRVLHSSIFLSLVSPLKARLKKTLNMGPCAISLRSWERQKGRRIGREREREETRNSGKRRRSHVGRFGPTTMMTEAVAATAAAAVVETSNYRKVSDSVGIRMSFLAVVSRAWLAHFTRYTEERNGHIQTENSPVRSSTTLLLILFHRIVLLRNRSIR